MATIRKAFARPRFPSGCRSVVCGSLRDTIETALALVPASERESIREAFIAACIPHWFDSDLLAALLDQPRRSRAGDLLNTLRTLPTTDPFPARGPHAYSIADAVRSAVRAWLTRDHPEQLRSLSARAAAYFQGSDMAIRIECIYHRLVAEGDHAAYDAESLDGEFWDGRSPGEHDVYAATLTELANEISGATGLLSKHSFPPDFPADKRRPPSESQTFATRARIVARKAAAQAEGLWNREESLCRWGEARSWCIEGEIRERQGDTAAAEASYGKYQTMMHEVASALPEIWRVQRELAIAEGRVGNAAFTQGNLSNALERLRGPPPSTRNSLPNGRTTIAPWRSPHQQSLQSGCVSSPTRPRVGGDGDLPGLCDSHGRAFREGAGNPLWLRNLAMAWNTFGSALFDSDLDQSLGAYQQSVALTKRWLDLVPIHAAAHFRSPRRIRLPLLRTIASSLPMPRRPYTNARTGIIRIFIQTGRIAAARELCEEHLDACVKSAALAPRDPSRKFAVGIAQFYLGEFHPAKSESACRLSRIPTSSRNLWRTERAQARQHCLATGVCARSQLHGGLSHPGRPHGRGGCGAGSSIEIAGHLLQFDPRRIRWWPRFSDWENSHSPGRISAPPCNTFRRRPALPRDSPPLTRKMPPPPGPSPGYRSNSPARFSTSMISLAPWRMPKRPAIPTSAFRQAASGLPTPINELAQARTRMAMLLDHGGDTAAAEDQRSLAAALQSVWQRPSLLKVWGIAPFSWPPSSPPRTSEERRLGHRGRWLSWSAGDCGEGPYHEPHQPRGPTSGAPTPSYGLPKA